MKKIIFIRAISLIAAIFFAGTACAEKLSEKIGVAHTAGNYYLTGKPFLIEGAEQIQSLGSKVIKVFLQHPKTAYPYNSVWPEDKDIPNIVDVLKTDYFKELFSMNFSTFILQTHLDTVDSCGWYDGLTDSEWRGIENNYYNAAIYLLKTYANTGIKFILEHWETDLYYQLAKKELLKKNLNFDPNVAQEGLIEYFNARAEGVKRAKNDAASEGIKNVDVMTAVEIIFVNSKPSDYAGTSFAQNLDLTDNFRIIDNMDKVRADAVAYSMSLECMQNMPLMVENIQTLIKKSGGRPWYFGEFAATETRFNPASGTKNSYDTSVTRSIRHKKGSLAQIDAALKMGAEYVVLWEIYHNENEEGVTNMDGYGLIREDGTKTALAEYLPSLLTMEEIPQNAFISKEYIESLAPGTNFNWFTEGASGLFATGANTAKLANNLTVPLGEGLVMHTIRNNNGRPGDSQASAGEPVTFFVDGYVGMTSFLMSVPAVPEPETFYSDSNFSIRSQSVNNKNSTGESGGNSGGGCNLGFNLCLISILILKSKLFVSTR